MDTIKYIEPVMLSPSPVPFDNEKQVRFADSVSVCPSPSPLETIQSYDDLHAIWYSLDDLLSFRLEARDLCRNMRLSSESASESTDVMKKPQLARDALTRGLEQRSCTERQRRKYMTTRLIVKAAGKLRHDPDKLAALAAKCSQWATELALEEASRDYQRAYHETAVVDDSERKNCKRRRSSAMDHTDVRRVKPRPTLICSL